MGLCSLLKSNPERTPDMESISKKNFPGHLAPHLAMTTGQRVIHRPLVALNLKGHQQIIIQTWRGKKKKKNIAENLFEKTQSFYHEVF